MVGATVLRPLRSFKTGIQVEASLQVIWAFNQPNAPVAAFSDDDVWRAAIFDAAVGHTDRGGHNWLGVPQPGMAPWSGLKLIDHGYAFPENDQPPNSDFYRQKAGQQIPGHLTPALLAVAANPPDLSQLVSQQAASAFGSRVMKLSRSGVLQLP
jgi:hypothetical protein